ncbi:MAG TPA: hypothetical protein VL418_03385 [Devosiaceae bacterium]|nr:hypothetical protein [Devosiaceae bacterium]
MTKLVATTVAALTIAAFSFGPAFAATTVTKTVVHHVSHAGMHEVCKTVMHNHHSVKSCTWVKNKPMMSKTVTTTKKM